MITANLLAKPPPLAPTQPASDEGEAPVQNGVDGSQREMGTQDASVDHVSVKPSLPGLLEVDTGLWTHITHTQTSILPMDSPTQQVEQLAK